MSGIPGLLDELAKKRKEKRAREEAARRASMSPLNRTISDVIYGAVTIGATVGAIYLFFSGTRDL